jgi:hypothetical protein
MEDLAGDAIYAERSIVELSDVQARGGRIFFEDSTLDATRLASVAGDPHGFYFTEGTATLRDISLSEAKGATDFASSAIVDNSTVTIGRMQIRDSASGLYAGKIWGRIEDLSVEDTTGAALVLFGGEIHLSRTHLEGNVRGITVREEAQATFEALVVSGVGDPQAACVDVLGSATVRDFILRDSEGHGARIQANASGDLSSGEISDNAIGIGYPSGYDLGRLTMDVVLRGNGMDLSPL